MYPSMSGSFSSLKRRKNSSACARVAPSGKPRGGALMMSATRDRS